MKETKETKEPEKAEAVYTDPEVSEIITALQTVYALDDAIANQMQINRPEGFVKPLVELRMNCANRLTALTAKGVPKEKKEETS